MQAQTSQIRDLLKELARPRLTGTSGAQEVSDILRTRFAEIGFQPREYPFSFSTIPGRFAVTSVGAIFLIGTLTSAALLNMRHPGVALVVLGVVLMLAGFIAALTPILAEMLPFKKVSTANLLFHKEGSRPRFLVMAHLDSKSQPLPLAFRGPAIIIAIFTFIALVVYAVFSILDPVYLIRNVTTLLSVLCFISGVLLVFCWVDNRSPGALDNASGLATLLGVAVRNRDQGDIGYLVTDGEELGLMGARDIARKLDPVIGVINVDGIDDDGPYHILERFGTPPRHIAPHLVAALLTAASEIDVPARRRKVPFGLLLDHIPLARRHLPAITLMRGSLRSLRRVHRPADSADVMNGSGIEAAVALVDRALAILRSQPMGPSL
ncbi:MAG TPA: M28 family peptidase [Longimicrobiales bacterium]|nr:M28 family peptidase [Longimicrobiales bacterium]